MNNLSLYQISTNYIEALDALTDPEMDLPIEAITDTLEGYKWRTGRKGHQRDQVFKKYGSYGQSNKRSRS